MTTNNLATKALLTTLTTGAWRATRLHQDESREENTRHGTADRAKVVLRVSDNKSLAEIGKIHAEARNEHYRLTVPSCDDGWRFLPCGRELEHSKMMQNYAQKHADCVAQFLADYAEEKSTAPMRLNGLYRPEFFPNESEVASRFKFQTRYMPVPDQGTWQEWLKEAAESGERELKARLRSTLTACAERLGNPDAIFRDSLIGNIADICGLSSDLNFSGNSAIAQASQEATDKLSTLDPSQLRSDKTKRWDAALEAQRLADLLA